MRAAYFRWLTGALVGASISRLGAAVRAQTTYSREFWPEIDLHHRFADRMTDMIGLVDTTRDRDSGSAYQGELGAVLDHRFLDWFSARIGYRHASALDGGSFREDRLLTEQTFRMALPPRGTIDFRTREDLRWPDTGNSMRLRERVMVSRETTIGRYDFQPYISAEIYYDTRYGQFARYRLIGGSTFPLVGWLAIEPYYARQVDLAGSSSVVDAAGLILHISF